MVKGLSKKPKEVTCDETGQSMLKFKNVEYKRSGIDDICKTIVNHEKNIQSILDGVLGSSNKCNTLTYKGFERC